MRRARSWLGGRDRADLGLALVVLAGATLRVGYVLARRGVAVEGDGDGYYRSAQLLADGHGFVSWAPFALTGDADVAASADHPPAWTLAYGLLAVLGFERVLWYQLFSALLGTVTVGAVGLTGRRIAGRRAGLIAAGLAAAYPNLWMYERVLQCETLALLLATLAIAAAHGYRERPSTRGALAMGGAVGLLTMTRPEAGLLLPFLVLPAVGLSRARPLATRARHLGLATLPLLAMLVPWATYNSLRFEEPVLLTTNAGQTLAAANCDAAYYSGEVGWWDFQCLDRATDAVADEGDASQRDLAMREIAADYIGDQQSRLPFVVLVREGRTWGFYQPFHQVRLDSVGGPSIAVGRAGLFAYWALLPVAVAGAVVLRRRGRPLSPFVAPAVTVVLACGATLGQTRYRALAEVALVLLAAVAVDAALGAWSRRRSPGGSPPPADQEILRPQLSLAEELPPEATPSPGGTRCRQSPSTTS